ncbi:hypothetical protein PV417_10065 [Streptomyces sp. ME19-03-3]|nr:hypothetical protein [Streptomyces sp. ME19-03-3]
MPLSAFDRTSDVLFLDGTGWRRKGVIAVAALAAAALTACLTAPGPRRRLESVRRR